MGERTLLPDRDRRHAAPSLSRASRQDAAPCLPDWGVRLYGLFDRDLRGNLGELGVTKTLDSTAAIALLGHGLIPADAAPSSPPPQA